MSYVICRCKFHTDGVIAVFRSEVEAEIAKGAEFYQLGDWPILLKACGCDGSLKPEWPYEPITHASAREFYPGRTEEQ